MCFDQNQRKPFLIAVFFGFFGRFIFWPEKRLPPHLCGILLEESQPSGLSGPYTYAPCWQKLSFSLKLKCCAPSAASGSFFRPKHVPEPDKIEHLSTKCKSLLKIIILRCFFEVRCHQVLRIELQGKTLAGSAAVSSHLSRAL